MIKDLHVNIIIIGQVFLGHYVLEKKNRFTLCLWQSIEGIYNISSEVGVAWYRYVHGRFPRTHACSCIWINVPYSIMIFPPATFVWLTFTIAQIEVQRWQSVTTAMYYDSVYPRCILLHMQTMQAKPKWCWYAIADTPYINVSFTILLLTTRFSRKSMPTVDMKVG